MANVAEIKRNVLSKRYILCYYPKEAERQKKHRHMIVELLKNELSSHKDQSATVQRAIERDLYFVQKRFSEVKK